jgi:putative endonuclease
MRERRYYVYMMTSSSRRPLYTGITNSLFRRKDLHEASDSSTFVGRYKAFRVVYFEIFDDVGRAINREKQIKGWTRAKKDALVRSMNPQWRDLSAEWKERYKPENQTQGPSPKNGAQDDKD